MTRMAISLLGSGLALAIASPALAEPVEYTATLSGANETAGGAPGGSGHFTGEFDPETGDVCYTLAAEGIGDPTAAHIHKGAAGKDGKPVITLNVTGPDDDLCIAEEPDLLKEILAAPSGYYVNVHSAALPKGAIRGQLEGDAVVVPDKEEDD